MKAAEDYTPLYPEHKGAEARQYPTHDWRDGLIVNDKGAPKALLANVLRALREADDWQGVLSYDTFTLTVSVSVPPPWASVSGSWTPRPWQGRDDVLATEWMQHNQIGVGIDVVASAIETAARRTETHAVRDSLARTKWNGKPRIDRWLHTYLGADDTDLMKAFGRGFLIGAIARVMKPGAKVDTLLVLEGAQGVGKSTALAILGGAFFTDEIADLGSKDAAMQLSGKWVVELSELDAMSKAEATRTKAFLSRSTDHYRPPYGRIAIDAPRQCVFAGTTNGEGWHKDETGGRRFWPVRVGTLDLKALKRDRDQLWAEAAHAYGQGAKWWLDEEALVAAAEEEQSARYQGDPWDDDVQRFVASLESVTVRDILSECLMIDTGRRDKAAEMRVARILKTLSFRRYQDWNGGSRRWVYRRE